MKLTFQHPFVQALKYTVLTGATLHLTIVFLIALFTSDHQQGSIANILALNLLWPDLGTTTWGFVASWAGIIMVFSCYFLLTLRRRRP
ncbi:MAG TPA: hypothetical protein VI322_01470 [Candidatus Saccharimonadia bacterium]